MLDRLLVPVEGVRIQLCMNNRLPPRYKQDNKSHGIGLRNVRLSIATAIMSIGRESTYFARTRVLILTLACDLFFRSELIKEALPARDGVPQPP